VHPKEFGKRLKTEALPVTISVQMVEDLTLSVPGEKLSSASHQMLLGVLFSNQMILPKIFEEKRSDTSLRIFFKYF
jgi:hypothetical protein